MLGLKRRSKALPWTFNGAAFTSKSCFYRWKRKNSPKRGFPCCSHSHPLWKDWWWWGVSLGDCCERYDHFHSYNCSFHRDFLCLWAGHSSSFEPKMYPKNDFNCFELVHIHVGCEGELEQQPKGEGFPSRATLELILQPAARLRSDRHCSHPSSGKTAWPWLIFPSDILGGGLLLPIFPARWSLFLLCSSPCVRNREETGMPAAQQETQTFSPGCSWQCVQQVSPKKLSLTSAVSFSTSGHQAACCLHSKSQNLLSLHPPSRNLSF